MFIYSKSHHPPGFYVYAYLRDNGTPYYIGKGSGFRMCSNSKSEQIHAPRNRDNIKILEANLTEIGALALERRYISWYGRIDKNTGILRNGTDGGDGASGLKRTPAQCAAITARQLGKPSGSKGKKFGPPSIKTRKQISIALLGRPPIIVVCPHCGIQGSIGPMNKWHFSKCRTLLENLSIRPHQNSVIP